MMLWCFVFFTLGDICPSWVMAWRCRRRPAAGASLSQRCQRLGSSKPGWQPERGSHPVTQETSGPFEWCNSQTCFPVRRLGEGPPWIAAPEGNKPEAQLQLPLIRFVISSVNFQDWQRIKDGGAKNWGQPTMMKSSRASPLRSSSTRVRGDSRGAINIPNFGSYRNRKMTVMSGNILKLPDDLWWAVRSGVVG